ncbi:MAG: hypothetical protein ACK4RZ_07490 [Paracoccaceae bacterium]
MKCVPVHDVVNDADAAAGILGQPYKRTICADVAALDQMLVYNRFGSFNPFGMIYALRRDLVPASQKPALLTADECDATLGTETQTGQLSPGDVRLKDCKRPRPLVLRANVGDILHVRMANLLTKAVPDLSRDFCAAPVDRGQDFAKIRKSVSRGDDLQVNHGEKLCQTGVSSSSAPDGNWPSERGLNFAVQGMSVFGMANGAVVAPHDACLGLGSVPSGAAVDCYYRVDREGPFFLASTAAPSGGQGDGGSITHGLFGAVMVQNTDTEWFRSQVTTGAFRAVWPEGEARHSVKDLRGLDAYRDTLNTGALANLFRPAGIGANRIDATHATIRDRNAEKTPILNMLRQIGDQAFDLVHSDLNAIIYTPKTETAEPTSFREFGVFFHDEIKAFYTRNFDELAQYDQLAGARDGFAINYGASGMGTMLLANRKGIGPAANCAECLYEEFFLTSWANGDPALLEHYPDDPSNVHHSYLNDAVVYRNFHAGPKETHVFHLHAHQWFAGNDKGRGAYLDSQTVGPQQGFSYHITGGGLEVYHPSGTPGLPGWYETLGSGNRNRTVGDSIFHCHLYPHFAQGMWELWRVHDVLEDGSRKLPDGQWTPGFSIAETPDRGKKRPGSVDHATGRLIDAAQSGLAGSAIGTPVPALVPLPTEAWPLLPSYPKDVAVLDAAGLVKADPVDEVNTFPGYPYYIAAKPGHRPPQAPMDIARAVDGKATPDDATDDLVTNDYLDGGLPRHVLLDGSIRKTPFSINAVQATLDWGTQQAKETALAQVVAKALALGDMTMSLEAVEVELIDYDGSPLEKAAMAFHSDGAGLDLRDATGASVGQTVGEGTYPSLASGNSAVPFAVNGAAPKPGAPFADPCGGPKLALNGGSGGGLFDPLVQTSPGQGTYFPDPALLGYRRYEGSAVQLDMVTNRAGWHDPQARINVLTQQSDGYKSGGGRWSPKVSADEQPFFFRALSGECIEFRHTNELPHKLELDDFQLRTPTDTIGQHIHLVKFDVTASDGSGNGFNYEDGTFAPDEIAHRICAAKNVETHGSAAVPVGDLITGTRTSGALQIREETGLCSFHDGAWHVSDTFYDKIWRLPLTKHRTLFQTTTQRWFADPILSDLRGPGQPGPTASGDARHDRTLRTVFSHDHFGPSSIQQHGFYTALVIEPHTAEICAPDDPNDCTAVRTDDRLILASAKDVGARKILRDNRPVVSHAGDGAVSQDFREFALAVADFALLYDPRNTAPVSAVLDSFGAGSAPTSDFAKGMGTLYCEGIHSQSPVTMQTVCGSNFSQASGIWFSGGNVPPAWTAAGRPDDLGTHKTDLAQPLLDVAEVATARYDDGTVDFKDLTLGDQLVRWRRMAAGYQGHDPKAPMARPVSAPQRPESISVDHHDPYLVNYRGEPLPLRLGADSSNSPDCALRDPSHWVAGLQIGVTERCEISKVRTGGMGDPANVFVSTATADGTSPMHGDPAVLPIVTNENDSVMIRLIQGAQEVQHSFTIEGYTWPRNLDQSFPADLPRMDTGMPRSTLVAACQDSPALAGGLPIARAGRPEEYKTWLKQGLGAFAPGSDALDYWTKFEVLLASCFNAEGRVAAQEIGISEHFEFSAAYLHDSNIEGIGGGKIKALSRMKRSPEDTEEVRLRHDMLETLASLKDVLRKADPSDSLVHFGSTDALWNGAWTVLRVHPTATRRFRPDYVGDVRRAISALDQALARDMFDEARLGNMEIENGSETADVQERQLEEAIDALRRGRELLFSPIFAPGPEQQIVPPVSDAPLPIRSLDLQPPAALRFNPHPLLNPYLTHKRLTELSRQRLADTVFEPQLRAQCDPSAPRVYTAIVAIEARSVFVGETKYSSVLRDPDGLFFAVVDPRRLVNKGDPEAVTPAKLDDPSSWENILFPDVVAEIQRVYDRPEPMALNVKAGDCVHAVWLNALRGTGKQGRLRDLVGDAPMPGITSINVDVDWSGEGSENQPIDFTGTSRADVAPSSRVAVSFPLPLMDRESSYARPYGVNPVWSLASAGTGDPATLMLSIEDRADRAHNERRAQIMMTQFYAGRAIGTPVQRSPWMLLSSLSVSGNDSDLGQLRQITQGLPLDLRTLDLDRVTALGLNRSLVTNILRPLRSDPSVGGLLTLLESWSKERSEALMVAQESILRVMRSDRTLAGHSLTLGEAVPVADLLPLMVSTPRTLAGEHAAAVGGVVRGRSFRQDQLWSHPVTLKSDLAKLLGFAATPETVDIALVDLEAALAARLSDPERAALAKVIDVLDIRLNDLEARLDGLVASLPITQEILRTIAALDVHFIPYAFGALPVKSTGDVIGHGAHGLFGAITVVPAGATISETRVLRRALRAQGRVFCLSPKALVGRLDDIGVGAIRTSPFVQRPDVLRPDFERVMPIANCQDFVMAPDPERKSNLPMWTAQLTTPGADGTMHRIRQFTLFWQDGLNLRDDVTKDKHLLGKAPWITRPRKDQKLVTDCKICDDSYDLGEKGVSYRSEPFHIRLRSATQHPESHYNLNAYPFPSPFFRLKSSETGSPFDAPIPVLRAEEGEEITVHVVHPGGRARQRAFVTIAQDYDDLFHGFGFPRGALLAPGKAITAQMLRQASVGCYLWFDGPAQTRAGGTWGLIDVVAKGEIRNPEATSCATDRRGINR